MRFPSNIVLTAVGFTIWGIGGIVEAEAGQFRIRNCLPEGQKIYVCAFNSTDTALHDPAEAGGVSPGKEEKFDCLSERCKTFIAISKPGTSVMSVKDAHLAGGIMMGVGAKEAVIGADLIATGVSAPVGLAVEGLAIVTFVTGAALPAIVEGLGKSDMCRRVVNHFRERHSSYGDKQNLSGHHVFTTFYTEGANPMAGYALAAGETCPRPRN